MVAGVANRGFMLHGHLQPDSSFVWELEHQPAMIAEKSYDAQADRWCKLFKKW